MKYTDFPNGVITDKEAQAALHTASNQVLRNLNQFTGCCMNHSSLNGFYHPCDNDQWTTGFWPGEIWLAYEVTKKDAFLNAGQVFVQDFLNRIEKKTAVDHHDMGFLYTPSCVSSWKLTGNKDARKAALLAADQLISRYQEKGEFIQAWGKMGEKENYRFIIDCLLNLPLLYWAGEETGKILYREIAERHLNTCMNNSIRKDGSTFHTFFMDMKTGEPDHGITCQGYKDDSSWARGQAWAIYGFALNFRYGGNRELIQVFHKVTDFYLSRLPSDLIPYWDLDFSDENTRPDSSKKDTPLYEPGGSTEPRDSSSAAIAACGLLEMADSLERMEGESNSKIETLRNTAKKMVASLVRHYSVHDFSLSNGQLIHGTYSKKTPFNTCTEEGVDECVVWGDYFYMESLARLSLDWKSWW